MGSTVSSRLKIIMPVFLLLFYSLINSHILLLYTVLTLYFSAIILKLCFL